MAKSPSFILEKKSDSDRPPPYPALSTKRQVYAEQGDPDFFKAVDEHVISVAKVRYKTFRDLMWNLIFKKNFDQLQTARAVFRWVTLEKFHNYTFKGNLIFSNKPDAILRGFKWGFRTHSEALQCLASYAGLHCYEITGWSKIMSNYKLGAPLTTHSANHSWNAMYINGTWRLMDSEAAQGDDSEFDEWYFMPDANQLIYTHFPEDPEWQLIDHVCSKEEFDQYPLTWPNFFNVGMTFLQQKQGVIFTDMGVVALTVGLTQPTDLTFTITFGEKGSEYLKGECLTRYVVQEIMMRRVTYYFRAPRNGNYYLTIFAANSRESLHMEELCGKATRFMIKSENAAPYTEPFPYNCSRYGPGKRMKLIGVTSSESRGIVKVYNGSYQVRGIVRVYNGSCQVTLKKTRPVKFVVHLRNDALSTLQLEYAVVLEDGENQAVVKCTLPQHGEYGLRIYANEPGKEIDSHTHVCQYLLSYKTQDFQTLYGKVEEVYYPPDVYATSMADSQTPSGTEAVHSEAASLPTTVPTAPPPPDPAPTHQLDPAQNSTAASLNSNDPTSPRPTLNCPVCLEEYKEIRKANRKLVSTYCGHIFCETCIIGCIQSQGSCPTCRNDLSLGGYHKLHI